MNYLQTLMWLSISAVGPKHERQIWIYFRDINMHGRSWLGGGGSIHLEGLALTTECERG